MEARIAHLESDVAHLRSDVGDIKVDVRALNSKIDDVDHRLGAKIEAVKDSIAAAKIWALTLYIAFAAALLGILARGFGWV
jgi:outer membrane murein-binding lipoprotein Lpp